MATLEEHEMHDLTLADLRLALRDLLGARAPALSACASGLLYAPLLREQLAALEALPHELAGNAPLVAELAALDRLHDRTGSAIWHLLQACLEHPSLDVALRDAARRILSAIVPSTSELLRPYADEAAAALQRLERLPALEPDLRRIPVPGGPTLYEWVAEFLGHGQRMDELLSRRTDGADAQRGRRGAAALRADALELLGKLRRTLADELRTNSALPRDLDAQIFAYLDELQRHGRARQAPSG